jgi:hypothetical protein
MNERDPLDALAELVAPFGNDPNSWDDVLRRAHAPSPTRQPGNSHERVLTPAATPPAAQGARPNRRWARPGRWQLGTAVGLLAAAAVVATPPGRAGAGWVGDTLGLVELGDPPTHHRPGAGSETRGSYVIATGHAPDGGRYELVLDRYPGGVTIADGEPVDGCLSLDWPDTAAGSFSGFCGPGFPPPQNGGRAPGGAPARPFGFLGVYPGATRYLALYGFTEPAVRRVAVTYPTADGTRHNATVDLIEPSAELHRRIGSIEPVNVFVAFLPSSAGADSEGSSKTLEVIAYDAAGGELGRVRHENLTNPSIRKGPAPKPLGG